MRTLKSTLISIIVSLTITLLVVNSLFYVSIFDGDGHKYWKLSGWTHPGVTTIRQIWECPKSDIFKDKKENLSILAKLTVTEFTTNTFFMEGKTYKKLKNSIQPYETTDSYSTALNVVDGTLVRDYMGMDSQMIRFSFKPSSHFVEYKAYSTNLIGEVRQIVQCKPALTEAP